MNDKIFKAGKEYFISYSHLTGFGSVIMRFDVDATVRDVAREVIESAKYGSNTALSAIVVIFFKEL